ncbi:hypothetical protein BJ742DRAFT_830310 [Cladochytrium replicatum]|nr:hypothetical protein BJ742DRAFT_830310 [Cladochytrium replicatum]
MGFPFFSSCCGAPSNTAVVTAGDQKFTLNLTALAQNYPKSILYEKIAISPRNTIPVSDDAHTFAIIANHVNDLESPLPTLDVPTLQLLLPELRRLKLSYAHDTFGKQMLRQLLSEGAGGKKKKGSGEISENDICVRWPASKKFAPIMLQYSILLFDVERQYTESEATQVIESFLISNKVGDEDNRPNVISVRRALIDFKMLARDDLGTLYWRNGWWPDEPKGIVYF